MLFQVCEYRGGIHDGLPEKNDFGLKLSGKPLLLEGRFFDVHIVSLARKKRKKRHPAGRRSEFGGPCRGRTYDKRIKSPLLYQLS
jgi:hypothetical protein